MAISIINQPQKYSPSDNPAIWQVTSDNPNIVFFRTTLKQAATSNTVGVFDFYTTPDYPQGAYMNFNRVLDNLVVPVLEPDTTALAMPLADMYFNYTLSIQERVYNTGTTLVDNGSITATTTATTYNASLQRMAFNGYNYLNYTIVTSGSPVDFLTNKPLPSVNDYSTEFVTFLNDRLSNLKVQVKTYTAVGVVKNTYTSVITGSSSYQAFRVQASPKALTSSLGVSFTGGVVYYTVQILNSSNSGVTVARQFNYVPVECGPDLLNMVFENAWGAFDSIQLYNPSETLGITKTSLQSNIYGLDDNNLYSDKKGLVYNPSERVIRNISSRTYKAYSKPLSDAEAVWLKELFQSKNVFIENTDGTFAPVSITNVSYTINKGRYIKDNLNTVEIDYTLTNGL